MARLVVSLVILVITLIVYGIFWLVQKLSAPPQSVRMVNYNPPPGVGYGRAGPFGGPPAGPGAGGPFGAPQAGFGGSPQPGYGAPQANYGAPQQGYGAPQQGYGAAPQAGYGMAPQASAPAPGALRVVVRPECTFDRLSDCMTRGGMSVTQPPGPAVQPGEPSTAVWQSEGAMVRYSFDPRTYLRALEISGPGAQAIRQGLVQMASLPALDGAQIAQLLQTPRPGDQMLGLAAAEYIGPGPEAQMYAGPLAALAQSPQPDIAQAAQRTRQRLGYAM